MEIKKPYDLRTGLLEEVLKEFDPDTFDSCVTDGPYGIGMMGKEWDTFKHDYTADGWKGYSDPNVKMRYRARDAGKYDLSYESMLAFQEWFHYQATAIFRVLKPGGYVVNFCSPRTFHRMVCAFEDAGFEIRDELLWIFGNGFPKSYNLEGEHEGWGTALKPSHEPIMLARKPFDGTVTQNVTRYGTGALHIDACRIPFMSEDDLKSATWGTQPDFRGNNYNNARPSEGKIHRKGGIQGNPKGRWPSNVIHDGSPEVLKEFPYTKSGQDNYTNATATGYQGNTYGKHVKEKGSMNVAYGDEGSAARFYYCPKISPEDRNEGLPDGGNPHPTVKPTDLMRWLCRLVTPVEGLILDPFAGSGSTGKAAIYELMNCVLIDKDPKNLPIQEARIKFALQNRTGQYGIFPQS